MDLCYLLPGLPGEARLGRERVRAGGCPTRRGSRRATQGRIRETKALARSLRLGVKDIGWTVGMLDKISEQITDAVQPAVGERLERLRVRALDGELQGVTDLEGPRFYVGGEVRLDFPQYSLFISWQQGAGWDVDCSVAARTSSFFHDAQLVDWELSRVQPWSELVGECLASVRVLAEDRTPHVIELTLGGHRLAMANSYKGEIGSGDDLLVMFDADFAAGEDLSLMWEV